MGAFTASQDSDDPDVIEKSMVQLKRGILKQDDINYSLKFMEIQFLNHQEDELIYDKALHFIVTRSNITHMGREKTLADSSQIKFCTTASENHCGLDVIRNCALQISKSKLQIENETPLPTLYLCQYCNRRHYHNPRYPIWRLVPEMKISLSDLSSITKL